jgi:AraC-like DNA-binding protein
MGKVSADRKIGLMQSFTSLLNTSMDANGLIIVPKQLGKGYLKVFNLDPGLRLMLKDYELFKPLPIKNISNQCSSSWVVLSFQNLFPLDTRYADPISPERSLPLIQVFPENIDSEILFSGPILFRQIVVAVEVAYLKNLLNKDSENKILAAITTSGSRFLFEEPIPSSIHKIALEMLEANVPDVLSNIYFKAKTEELIYYLFAALLRRDTTSIAALNTNDIQTVYGIRDSMLAQLTIPPDLDKLAAKANFSKSKLKRLFKQIFGVSIFRYYQSFRMQEAARLLKQHQFSVSEVGYQMGFSNLSHFTRIFEAYVGVKPKKFSMVEKDAKIPIHRNRNI